MSRFIKIDHLAGDERTAYFKDLFPEKLLKNKRCRLIGAMDQDGIPEGVVLFSLNGQTAELLHIEVYPELRRQGIGTALIKTLLRYLSMAELPFMLQAVYAVDEEDGAEADAFFRSMPDFTVVRGGKYYTVKPDTIKNPSRFDFVFQYECDVTMYSGLSKAEKSSLLNDLKERKASALLPKKGEKVIEDLSLCHLENGHCTACVIFRESDIPDTITLSFLMSKPHKEDHLAGVLHEVIKRFRASYMKKNITFNVVNQDSELVAKRFFLSDMKTTEIWTAVSFGEV